MSGSAAATGSGTTPLTIIGTQGGDLFMRSYTPAAVATSIGAVTLSGSQTITGVKSFNAKTYLYGGVYVGTVGSEGGQLDFAVASGGTSTAQYIDVTADTFRFVSTPSVGTRVHSLSVAVQPSGNIMIGTGAHTCAVVTSLPATPIANTIYFVTT